MASHNHIPEEDVHIGNNLLSVRTIVAIGIGAAIFVILGRFGSVPSGVPNTNVETAYAVLALLSVIFGPVAGVLIGLIGHAIKDAVMYGSIWFSWVIASGVVGLVIGLAMNKIKVSEGVFGSKEIIQFNLYQIIANVIAWFAVAPLLDILIYAEPVNKVWTQGIVAGVANIVTVGVIGTLLLLAYSKTRTKSASLKKEA
jgi:energy-coupling factor transport system substrate-specific component